MHDVETRIQLAAETLATSLRLGDGIAENAAQSLKASLADAAQQLAERDSISKSLANLFVDLASGIEACSHSYTGTEAEKIRWLADDIADRVRQCLVEPKSKKASPSTG